MKVGQGGIAGSGFGFGEGGDFYHKT